MKKTERRSSPSRKGRETLLTERRNMKMARSAHAYMRGGKKSERKRVSKLP